MNLLKTGIADNGEASKGLLATSIAGEVALSDNPGRELQKWRNIFMIPQKHLADRMGIMSSVISDYESGRRKSPGVRVIRNFVSALLDVDRKNGSTVTNGFLSLAPNEILSDIILDMRDYPEPRSISDFMEIVDGEFVTETENPGQAIHGHIIVDTINAVLKLSSQEMDRLHALAKRRAVIFTGVNSGRSALIAVKITNLKPGVIILHGAAEIDPLAQRIAQSENIPVILSKIKDVDELVNSLKTQATIPA